MLSAAQIASASIIQTFCLCEGGVASAARNILGISGRNIYKIFKNRYFFFFFFLNDPPPTEIYPLPLHAALPIYPATLQEEGEQPSIEALAEDTQGFFETPLSEIIILPTLDELALLTDFPESTRPTQPLIEKPTRSEEHTSELQSQSNLVCRLLLE